MLKRFWELIEVTEFLRSKKNKDIEIATMTDPARQADLIFLVDMTQRLDDLNLKLQGISARLSTCESHLSVQDKVAVVPAASSIGELCALSNVPVTATEESGH